MCFGISLGVAFKRPQLLFFFFYSNWAPKKQKSMSEKGQFET